MTLGVAFESVLVAAQANAPWALRTIYDDLGPVVTGYLRARGAREPDDVASEAFLHVFQKLGTFSGDEPAFRSWVFTIVHRRLTDERRQRGRRVAQDLAAHLPAISGGDVEQEALEQLGSTTVSTLLAELSPGQRDVILLRIVADMSVDEVAHVLGKRPGAVRALQHRGLQRLRKHLEQMHAGDQVVANSESSDAAPTTALPRDAALAVDAPTLRMLAWSTGRSGGSICS